VTPIKERPIPKRQTETSVALGEFSADSLPPADRAALTESLAGIYGSHPDPGLRGAAEWLLRAWGQGDRLEAIDKDAARRAAQSRRLFSRFPQYLHGKVIIWASRMKGQSPSARHDCI
jgi:hypothetical protein